MAVTRGSSLELNVDQSTLRKSGEFSYAYYNHQNKRQNNKR